MQTTRLLLPPSRSVPKLVALVTSRPPLFFSRRASQVVSSEASAGAWSLENPTECQSPAGCLPRLCPCPPASPPRSPTPGAGPAAEDRRGHSHPEGE